MIEVVRTPVEYFNLIAGGLRFSTLCEAWGANRSGKTTFCYQTIGTFMEDYPDGVVHLLDNESSFDEVRCKHAFNWDLVENKKFKPDKQDSSKQETWLYKRVNIVPVRTLEEGFFHILQILKVHDDKKPCIIMWDTIDAAPSQKSFENAMEAKDPSKMNMFTGGMGDRPRVIKHYLQDVMALMFRRRVLLLTPNQIHSGIGPYAKTEISGGGNALKHNRHYSFYFKLMGKEVQYDDMSLVSSVVSDVTLEKSKFSPGFEKVPIFIDVRQGGVIDATQSLLLAANKFKFVQDKMDKSGKKRTGYYFVNHPSMEGQLLRWAEIVEKRDLFMPTIKKAILARLASTHFLIKMLYDEMGRTAEVEEALKGVDPSQFTAPMIAEPGDTAEVVPVVPDVVPKVKVNKVGVVPVAPVKKGGLNPIAELKKEAVAAVGDLIEDIENIPEVDKHEPQLSLIEPVKRGSTTDEVKVVVEPEALGEKTSTAKKKKRRGRPKGSKNKKKDE